MSTDANNPDTHKTITENTMFSGLTVPLAIVLVGILVIWGVTKMVSSDRDHRDLIKDLETKTFGNKWVNAYELSKLLATNKISESEMPWVIDRLSRLYELGTDNKTKNFLIVALAAMNNPRTGPVLHKALDDKDSKIQFSALSGIGNLPVGSNINWIKVSKFFNSKDTGLVHIAILAAAHHRVTSLEPDIERLLVSENVNIKRAAALGLINFKNENAMFVLNEILRLPYAQRKKIGESLNEVEAQTLKLNVISALVKNKWSALNESLQFVAENDSKDKVSIKAKEALILLKNR